MSHAACGSRMRRWVWLIVLFVIAAGVRAGWVCFRYGGQVSVAHEYPDEKAYWDVARSLAAGNGLVDEFGYRATYMPGYPAFLALFADRAGAPSPTRLYCARLTQAVVGAFIAPVVYILAAGWLSLAGPELKPAGSRAAIPVLAGLAVAIDPFLMFFSGLLLTETLFAVALALAWTCVLLLCRRDRRIGPAPVIGVGLMLWLCLMLRPSAVVLILPVAVAMPLARRFDRQGLVAAVAVLLLVAVGLSPWAARNRRAIGEWRWLTTRGGISLYDGFQPQATGASDLAHTKTMPQVQGLSEVEWDRFFRNQAWSAIRQDPGRAVRLAWAKFRRTWSPWPNVANYRGSVAGLAGALWTICILVLAVVGWWVHRRAVAAWMLLLLPVAAFTLLHMVYVGSVRYRLPVMPFVTILAAAGLVRLVAAARGCRSVGRTPSALGCEKPRFGDRSLL
ncbi:MAG: hypothetical protein ACUVXJ_14560 [Phycisphaerae bacterium]